MNGEQLITMGRLMLAQSRTEDAERLLGQAVAEMPNNAEAKSLLAFVVSMDRDRLTEATHLAQQAISDDPEEGLGFRALSTIQLKRNDPKEALASIQQAIMLEPHEVVNYGCKAQCLMVLQRWADALDTAEVGLKLEPDDETCSSIRLLALERLGRVSDALNEGQRLVQNSPDSAEAHASQGWALLNNDDYKGAQAAFREALRLDPSSEFARMGMAEAIKQTNFLYRGLLKFSMFISRFSGKQQIIILVGIWLAMFGIPKLAAAVPAFEPYALPLKLCFFVLVLATWILPILANTVLRFHPFGKFLLSRRENVASLWMGIVLLLGVVWAIAGYAIMQDPFLVLLAAILSLYLAIPLKLTIDANEGPASYICYTVAIIFSLGFLVMLASSFMGDIGTVIVLLGIAPYVYGILIYSFVGSWVANIEPKL